MLRVLPMSSSASSRVPHRVSPCTFHVSPQFPSWHATVRPSVRPAVRLSVRPSMFPIMCPTVRPSVCPSVRPVCVLLRVLLVSSNVSSCVPHRVSPCTIHVTPQFPSGCVSPRAVHVFTPNVHPGMRPCDFPCVPHAFPHESPPPLFCVILRVPLVSSNAYAVCPTVCLHAPPMCLP